LVRAATTTLTIGSSFGRGHWRRARRTAPHHRVLRGDAALRSVTHGLDSQVPFSVADRFTTENSRQMSQFCPDANGLHLHP